MYSKEIRVIFFYKNNQMVIKKDRNLSTSSFPREPLSAVISSSLKVPGRVQWLVLPSRHTAGEEHRRWPS